MHIGLPFSLLIFADAFVDAITTNWIMYSSCVTLSYNHFECTLLGSKHQDDYTHKLEQKVQPCATVIGMVAQLTRALITATLCFFIGPWSDKYGRKPAMLLGFAGCSLSHLIMAAISVVPNLSPWFTLLATIPFCFTGGYEAATAAASCYINDLTLPEHRGFRLAIFYGITAGGSFIGSMSSSYALYIFDYFVIYLIAAVSVFLGWLTIFLFLQESIPNPCTEKKLISLFKISLVGETIKAAFKERENHNRCLILLIIGILLVYSVPSNSTNLLFMYVRDKFHWSLETYTVYNSINTVVGTLTTTLGIYCLLKMLRMRESRMILIGVVSFLCSALLTGLATRSWHIYAGGILNNLCVVSPISRSLLSKVIPPDDYGKVFSLVEICQLLVLPLGVFCYTFTYNKTLETFPGAFNFISVALYATATALSLFLIVVRKRQEQSAHDTLHSETSLQ